MLEKIRDDSRHISQRITKKLNGWIKFLSVLETRISELQRRVKKHFSMTRQNRHNPNFKLRTRPFGASVTINGKFVGMAGLQGIDVPWDQGEILVKKDGYRSELLKFSSAPNSSEIALELVPFASNVRKKQLSTSMLRFGVGAGFIAIIVVSLVAWWFISLGDKNESQKNTSRIVSPDIATVKEATPPPPVDEITRIRTAAEAGDANSQAVLGDRFREAKGVPKDDVQSVTWYRRAAEQGHAGAQLNLGWMISMGRGVRKDDVEAAKWYRMSADQGEAMAQSNLGSMYQSGRGVPQNDSEAVRWFKKSVEQGSAGGQYGLGFMYKEGIGVRKNEAKALELFRQAAEQGYANAELALGKMLESGLGVPKDYNEAAKWYQKAADQGNSVAQSRLGMMYMYGRGVPLDRVEGQKWLERSRESKN